MSKVSREICLNMNFVIILQLIALINLEYFVIASKKVGTGYVGCEVAKATDSDSLRCVKKAYRQAALGTASVKAEG